MYIIRTSLQTCTLDYDLVSYCTSVVCINFIHECQDLQCNGDFEIQILGKLSTAILFNLKVLARNLLRESRPENIFFCI